MAATSIAFGCLLTVVLGSPLAAPDPVAQLSLPGVPSVPGFIGPLSSLVPPTPVLQFPSPALDSPPFTGSDIKPKKIGYFFVGAGDNDHAGMIL